MQPDKKLIKGTAIKWRRDSPFQAAQEGFLLMIRNKPPASDLTVTISPPESPPMATILSEACAPQS
jgi:hypothetical protein